MTDMKCPFCGQKLNKIPSYQIDGDWFCPNCCMSGTKKLWQELISTRKALDVATKCINWVIDTYRTGQDQEADVLGICEFAAEEINQIKTITEKE